MGCRYGSPAGGENDKGCELKHGPMQVQSYVDGAIAEVISVPFSMSLYFLGIGSVRHESEFQPLAGNRGTGLAP